MTSYEMTRRRRLLGVLLCIFTIVLAILDQNIVSSAIVPIVRDLDPVHGVEHVAWLVAAFALAATVVLPLYGRLCDAFGPKPVWLGAVAVFLLGSVLCGAAQTMGQLIAFRAVQGIGAGGLMSVTMVVLAHLAEPGASRGKGAGVGGLFAGVGMAIGPFIGGLFADHGSWRGIFYVNVPLAVIVIVGGLFAIHLPKPPTANPESPNPSQPQTASQPQTSQPLTTGRPQTSRPQTSRPQTSRPQTSRPQTTRRVRDRLDLTGAALAAVFAGSLLLMCEWGGQRYPWTSPTILALAAAAIASLALFGWRESVAAHPVLPPSLLRDRTIRGSYAIQLLIGAAMIGAMVHLMLYLQIARGVSATDSGLYLAFMAAGLTISGLATARLRSTRAALLAGTACSAAALAALVVCVHESSSLWAVRGALVLLGAGFGLLIGRLITVVQDAAPRHQLGVATTGIRFFQSLGTAVGAAALGSVLSRVYESRTGTALAATAIAMPDFTAAIEIVFTVAGAVVLLALLIAARLPINEPTTDQPTANQPARNQAAANQAAPSKAPADRPAANQAATDEPAKDRRTANQPSADHATVTSRP